MCIMVLKYIMGVRIAKQILKLLDSRKLYVCYTQEGVFEDMINCSANLLNL